MLSLYALVIVVMRCFLSATNWGKGAHILVIVNAASVCANHLDAREPVLLPDRQVDKMLFY